MQIHITIYSLLSLAAAVFSGAAVYFRLRAKRAEAEKNDALSRTTAEKDELSARLQQAQKAAEDLRQEASAKELSLTGENSALKARIEMIEQHSEKQREELGKLQDSFRLEFRNLANDILEEKARQMGTASLQTIDTLLGPFKSSITEFRQRVEAIYADENRQRGALQNEIRSLHELNRRITEETTNLTNALKGNSKVQGDWGEMILQSLLEHSNLIAGIHFTTQQNLKDAEGNNLRPDVVLNLPGGKQIVIDSKVSLTAYAGYCSDCQAPQREKYLKDHLASVRRHVDELGRKSYQQLLDSPDFVIMFIPNEPAYLCAMQNDPDIWGDAYNKKVIVSSPTNLLALLKIVDELWRRDDQSRNAVEIAEEGAKLYDKFAGFVETLEAVGKSIAGAGANYEKALKQLSTGSGSLVSRTEKLRKLGIKARKSLSIDLLSNSTANIDTGGEED
ncbi:MAG: DNA recombination protein RmuC [Rikenellaceae bacterium]|nr:DNA recombination protein RmuC [Rikenellaceae bacterium]